MGAAATIFCKVPSLFTAILPFEPKMNSKSRSPAFAENSCWATDQPRSRGSGQLFIRAAYLIRYFFSLRFSVQNVQMKYSTMMSLQTSGVLDNSFSSDGVVITNISGTSEDKVYDVEVAPDKKL